VHALCWPQYVVFLSWAAAGWPQGYGWRWRLVFKPPALEVGVGGAVASLLPANAKAAQSGVQVKISFAIWPQARTMRIGAARRGRVPGG
jgi:hypothetical protein